MTDAYGEEIMRAGSVLAKNSAANLGAWRMDLEGEERDDLPVPREERGTHAKAFRLSQEAYQTRLVFPDRTRATEKPLGFGTHGDSWKARLEGGKTIAYGRDRSIGGAREDNLSGRR
ncbi:hypothetical protein RB195_005980 [Necator americanus]|uniref:Uncharacterized protein n=1 Tax=Necator americanus TaxID=51031 RepID=A0ABR1BQG0_NECAM